MYLVLHGVDDDWGLRFYSSQSLGKMFRASSEAVVVLADRDCPAVCAFRAVTAYISAAQLTGWDFGGYDRRGTGVACRSRLPV